MSLPRVVVNNRYRAESVSAVRQSLDVPSASQDDSLLSHKVSKSTQKSHHSQYASQQWRSAYFRILREISAEETSDNCSRIVEIDSRYSTIIHDLQLQCENETNERNSEREELTSEINLLKRQMLLIQAKLLNLPAESKLQLHYRSKINKLVRRQISFRDYNAKQFQSMEAEKDSIEQYLDSVKSLVESVEDSQETTIKEEQGTNTTPQKLTKSSAKKRAIRLVNKSYSGQPMNEVDIDSNQIRSVSSFLEQEKSAQSSPFRAKVSQHDAKKDTEHLSQVSENGEEDSLKTSQQSSSQSQTPKLIVRKHSVHMQSSVVNARQVRALTLDEEVNQVDRFSKLKQSSLISAQNNIYVTPKRQLYRKHVLSSSKQQESPDLSMRSINLPKGLRSSSIQRTGGESVDSSIILSTSMREDQNDIKSIKECVMKLDTMIKSIGGASCGWQPDEHRSFQYLMKKYGRDGIDGDKIIEAKRDRSIDSLRYIQQKDLVMHAKVVDQYEDLMKQKGKFIEQFQEIKSRVDKKKQDQFNAIRASRQERQELEMQRKLNLVSSDKRSSERIQPVQLQRSRDFMNNEKKSTLDKQRIHRSELQRIENKDIDLQRKGGGIQGAQSIPVSPLLMKMRKEKQMQIQRGSVDQNQSMTVVDEQEQLFQQRMKDLLELRAVRVSRDSYATPIKKSVFQSVQSSPMNLQKIR